MRCDSATLDLTRIPTKMRLMLRTGLALVVLLTQLAIAHAAPAQQHRLAVVELRNTAGLRDEEVTYLTDQARTQASKALAGERFLMMTRESIVALLPPGKTLADCAKMQCEVEVGRTIGAECLQEACQRSLRQRREGGASSSRSRVLASDPTSCSMAERCPLIPEGAFCSARCLARQEALKRRMTRRFVESV
jgi:hypothetical protein